MSHESLQRYGLERDTKQRMGGSRGKPGAKAPVLSDEAVRAVEPVLHAYARRALRDAETARDLVQDTLTVAVATLHEFEGRSALRTWLIGILSHKIMDHFRKAKTRALHAAEGEPVDLLTTPSREQLERVVMNRQAIRVLEQAIGELPELERMATLLVDVEQLDRDEVCNVLAVTPTHLRVLLHRARHRLRRKLEDVAL